MEDIERMESIMRRLQISFGATILLGSFLVGRGTIDETPDMRIILFDRETPAGIVIGDSRCDIIEPLYNIRMNNIPPTESPDTSGPTTETPSLIRVDSGNIVLGSLPIPADEINRANKENESDTVTICLIPTE
jgi:hypothetical protein